MLPRILEPEAMDGPDEARDYDAMDHRAVNDRFVSDFLDAFGARLVASVLDVGTGTARIPIALCRLHPGANVLGIDLADAMLDLGRKNVSEAGLADRIRLERHDARRIDLPDGAFSAVISNTIIHHIPDPGPVLAEMIRLVAPDGLLFVRDLARPSTREQLEALVETHAGHESPAAKRLFADSLHAALSVEEVRGLLAELGLHATSGSLTSDRHWTLAWERLR